MVPDSGKEIDFTDCVVPESKSNDADNMIMYKETASSSTAINLTSSVYENVSGPDIGELNRVTPLLHYAESSYLSTLNTSSTASSSQSVLPHAYNLQSAAHLHSLTVPCFNPTLFQLSGPSNVELSLGSNAQNSYCSTDNASTVNPSRLVQSSEQLNILSHFSPSVPSHTQRRRRNSSGSESRMRRHSAAPFRTVSLTPHIQRQRRRSHDVGDEQIDLLERLRIAATRRRSFSAPFQSSRIQGSSRILNLQ